MRDNVWVIGDIPITNNGKKIGTVTLQGAIEKDNPADVSGDVFIEIEDGHGGKHVVLASANKELEEYYDEERGDGVEDLKDSDAWDELGIESKVPQTIEWSQLLQKAKEQDVEITPEDFGIDANLLSRVPHNYRKQTMDKFTKVESIKAKAAKLVKNLFEGGGAGIEMTVRGIYATFTVSNGEVTITESSIDSFDLHGYQDGHSNLRGDLIKVTDVSTSRLSGVEAQAWSDRSMQLPDGTYTINGKEAKAMKWAGYTRGLAEDFLPLEYLKGDLEITDESGVPVEDCYASIEVSASSEEFVYCYNDIFEVYEFSDQDQAEQHAEDITANYGAR